MVDFYVEASCISKMEVKFNKHIKDATVKTEKERNEEPKQKGGGRAFFIFKLSDRAVFQIFKRSWEKESCETVSDKTDPSLSGMVQSTLCFFFL